MESETITISQSSGQVTFLDRLWSPTSSDLTRKQNLASSPPKEMKKRKGAVFREPSGLCFTKNETGKKYLW